MPERRIKVFLDSNVILSGLISSKGIPKIILDLLSLALPTFQGLTGAYNLEEIRRNLAKKFPDLLPTFEKNLPHLHLEIVGIPPYEKVAPWLDKMSPKDAPVLVSAIEGRADYLVTGNIKDFPKETDGPMKIVNPKGFIEKAGRHLSVEKKDS